LGSHGRASKTNFYFARRRTAIAIHLISVVTFFARIDVAVATGGGAGLRLACAVLANWLFRASLGAALAIAVEHPVLGSEVALLASLYDSIAANGKFTWQPWPRADGTWL
jgi:hypothetical protein